MSEEIIWHEQQENILKKWGEIGSSYRFMHDRAYLKFEKQNLRFALPVIILSTITGTANFAQSSFPASWQPYVPLFAGFLNLSAGLITTIAQFLRVSELLEGHRAASIAYSKFSRNISVELSLPKDERSCGGRDFVGKCRMDLDRLIEQSPNIPLEIVKIFGKKFEGYSFIKPDILEITCVDVYKDNDKEKKIKELYEFDKKQKELELIKQKMDYEESLVKKIRNEEIKKQEEFEKKLKEKLIEAKKQFQNTEKNRLAENKSNKKKNIGILNISKSMNSLIKKLESADKKNEVITPETSDTESSCSDKTITPINLKNEKISHLEINIMDNTDADTSEVDVNNIDASGADDASDADDASEVDVNNIDASEADDAEENIIIDISSNNII